jgi:integrase
MLLRDYAERWLSSDLAKAPTTKARDAVVLKKHILPALGALPLAEVTSRDVQDLVQAMACRLAPKTVRTNAGVLQAVLSSAVREGFLYTSPYRSPRLPPLDREEHPRLTVAQQRLLAAAMPEPYRIMVFLGGVLGLRWSEVVGLRVADIDFLARPPFLKVDRPIVEVSGRLMASRGKTPGSRSRLTLPPFLVRLLAQHLAVAGRNQQEDLVVQAPRGGPLRAVNFRLRVWGPAVKEAGFPGLTFHGLRHSAAGVMRQAGASDHVVQHRMRHSHRATTTDIYGWAPDAMDAVALGALERLWSDEDGMDMAREDRSGP